MRRIVQSPHRYNPPAEGACEQLTRVAWTCEFVDALRPADTRGIPRGGMSFGLAPRGGCGRTGAALLTAL